MMSDKFYNFFGAPLSLYSGKVRCYLRKKGLPYRELLPSHKLHFEKIVPAVGRIVLPTILTPDGAVLQDTALIIEELEKRHSDSSLSGDTPVHKALTAILELIGDEALLRPAMHYRWSYKAENDPFITLEFARTIDFSAPYESAKTMAAPVMAQMSGYLPMLGITEQSRHAIEANYIAFLEALDRHLMRFPYLLGGKPTIGDCAFMGPLFAHLGRDPYPATLMKQKAHHVYRWVERMNAHDLDIPELAGAEPVLADIEGLAPTLLPVLKAIAVDFAPELEGLSNSLNTYLSAHQPAAGTSIATKKLPPADPIHITLGGAELAIGARPFTAFKRQRVQDRLAPLNQSDRSTIDSLLMEAGLLDGISSMLDRRIERVGYKEVWGE